MKVITHSLIMDCLTGDEAQVSGQGRRDGWAEREKDKVVKQSLIMGFWTGDESQVRWRASGVVEKKHM